MKPRLDPLPLTAEDREIWFYLAPLSGPGVDRVRRFRLAIAADRRDADTMMSAAIVWRSELPAPSRHYALAAWCLPDADVASMAREALEAQWSWERFAT